MDGDADDSAIFFSSLASISIKIPFVKGSIAAKQKLLLKI